MPGVMVEYFFYFVFESVVDGDGLRGRRRNFPAFNLGWFLVWSEEGYMEYQVDLEGVWEGKFDGNRRYALGDTVRASVAVL